MRSTEGLVRADEGWAVLSCDPNERMALSWLQPQAWLLARQVVKICQSPLAAAALLESTDIVPDNVAMWDRALPDVDYPQDPATQKIAMRPDRGLWLWLVNAMGGDDVPGYPGPALPAWGFRRFGTAVTRTDMQHGLGLRQPDYGILGQQTAELMRRIEGLRPPLLALGAAGLELMGLSLPRLFSGQPGVTPQRDQVNCHLIVHQAGGSLPPQAKDVNQQQTGHYDNLDGPNNIVLSLRLAGAPQKTWTINGRQTFDQADGDVVAVWGGEGGDPHHDNRVGDAPGGVAADCTPANTVLSLLYGFRGDSVSAQARHWLDQQAALAVSA